LLKNFLCFLVTKRRLFFIQKILKDFINTCSQKRGEVSAKLIAAKKLNENEVNKIKDELSKNFSTKVKLDYKYDPSLIGGLIIQVGSVMIDTSIQSKLKQLENIFKKNTRSEEEFSNVLKLISKYKIISQCYKKAEHFINLAKNSLTIFKETKEKKILENLTSFSLERSF